MYATKTKPVQIAIDPTVDDQFYRYKMDQLQMKTETNKTVLVNMDIVCTQLKIDPQILAKYLAVKMGARVKFDSKKKHWYIYSESVTTTSLSLSLIDFIQAIVLCQKCRLPELVYIHRKKNTVISCNSCGWKGSPDDISVDAKVKKLI